MEQQWVKLLELQRQGIAEVAIHGAMAWVHGDTLVSAQGHVCTFGRSLMKPFQIRVFAQDLAPKLSWEAKAVSVSSHNAEPAQVEAAQSMLLASEVGLLQTPLSLPLLGSTNSTAAPQRWHHPCSGKHAAILAGCRLRGWEQNYLDANHPYHEAYLAELRSVLGATWTSPVTATDGCGLPTHAMTLAQMAQLFSALVRRRNQDWIWKAMVKYPDFVGGKGRLDTGIMNACGGRVLAKEGADGLLGMAIEHPEYPQGLGIVIKIAHGWDPKSMGYLVSRVLKELGFDYAGPAIPPGQVAV